MRKGWIALFTGMILFLSSMPLHIWGQGHSRSITADYYGMEVWVDGLPVDLHYNAFMFDGDIYMALPDLLRSLSLEGEYDVDNDTLSFNSSGMLREKGGDMLAAEVLQKNYEIDAIERQIKALELELQKAEEAAKQERLSGPSISTISQMRSYLRDHFDYLEDVPVSLNFRRIRGDRFELNITFSNRDADDFKDIPRRYVEDYLEDLFYTVRELYNEDATLEGSIGDNRSRNAVTYVEFDTRRDGLRFNFHSSAYRSQLPLPSFMASADLVGDYTSRILFVSFPSLRVELDGERQNWFKDPFFYGGTLYLSLEDVADLFYLHYQMEEEHQRVHIITSGVLQDNMLNTSHHLSYNNSALARLTPRLEELQEEVTFLRSSRYPHRRISTISGMQSYLKAYFGELEDIPMTLRLRHRRNNEYSLDITFPRSYRWDFEDIDRRIIEGWMDDMFYAIRGLYDPKAVIWGEVRDSRSSNAITFLEFDTRDHMLAFDFKRSNHREDVRGIHAHQLEDHLYSELRRHDGIRFDYEVLVNRRDIDLVVTFDSRRFDDWHISDKINYLHLLQREIDAAINVNGRMIDTRYEEEVLRFSFEDGYIRSFDLLTETEEDLNKDFGRWDDLKLTYSIRESSPDVFEVKVEGDFSREDAAWRDIENYYMEEFEDFILEAFRYIQRIWDVSVLGEVVDQELVLLTSVDLYDRDVRPVYANPFSGGIANNSFVELWSQTSDADIYYTMRYNGVPNNPTTTSSSYTNPIQLSGNVGDEVVMNAFAVREGMTPSPINTFTYEIMDISDGLDSIVINSVPEGSIEGFNFRSNTYIYEDVIASPNVESIRITAVGNGDIIIDGEDVESGEASREIPLDPGVTRRIDITHEEDGKEPRSYRLHILRAAYEDAPVIQLANHTFSHGIVGVFSGELQAVDVPDFDFTGYSIGLLSRSDNAGDVGGSNNPYTLDASGAFSITGFNMDMLTRLIGYRYIIYDPAGDRIGGADLERPNP